MICKIDPFVSADEILDLRAYVCDRFAEESGRAHDCRMQIFGGKESAELREAFDEARCLSDAFANVSEFLENPENCETFGMALLLLGDWREATRPKRRRRRH